MARMPGTDGYAEEAPALVARYEAIRFSEIHRQVLHLVPATACRILDIGAGTGRDAAGFAALGHEVVAVEPTEALRTAGMARHLSERITWLDDGLPGLERVRARGEQFDVIMLTAVWMHLDVAERARGMEAMAALAAPGGKVIFSLRHGPVPAGRRMFDVSAAETVSLGERHGFRGMLELAQASVEPSNQRDGVTWSRVALQRRT